MAHHHDAWRVQCTWAMMTVDPCMHACMPCRIGGPCYLCNHRSACITGTDVARSKNSHATDSKLGVVMSQCMHAMVPRCATVRAADCRTSMRMHACTCMRCMRSMPWPGIGVVQPSGDQVHDVPACTRGAGCHTHAHVCVHACAAPTRHVLLCCAGRGRPGVTFSKENDHIWGSK